LIIDFFKYTIRYAVDENERVHEIDVVVRPSAEWTTSLVGVSVDCRLDDAAARSATVVLVVVAHPIVLAVTSIVVVELVVVVLTNVSYDEQIAGKKMIQKTI
jgi:hypothetical protein